MGKGILYGVGVGPGDPSLMTLKAVDIVGRCRVVAAPRTKNGGMVALDIAAGATDLSGKEIVPLDFAMSRSAEERAASHARAADRLRPFLDNGEAVAMLNLGDVSIYASFRYIADILVPEGYPYEMIPGITSFCAAAAQLGTSLTDMETPLHIIPDGAGEQDAPIEPGTTIWMKSGRNLPGLLQNLRDAGVAPRTMVVQNCGMPDQRIYRGVDGVEVETKYFTVAILKNAAGEPER